MVPPEHGPRNWFLRGVYPSCTCGFAPRDNAKLNAHWAENGFRIVDDHGHLVRQEIAKG